MDPQRYEIIPQEEDRAEVGGKRKLPSPEGGVRQPAMPQPHSGRERRGQDEEEEEEQQRLIRQGGAIQDSGVQEEGQCLDGQHSKGFSGGESRGYGLFACFVVAFNVYAI